MKLKHWMVITVVAGMVVAFWNIETAPARPQYKKTFQEIYPKLDEAVKKEDCNVCHGKDKNGKSNKKLRNNYGESFGKALNKKNEKAAQIIRDALKKSEGEKSAIEGKTFGDLIQDGKLPNAK